MKLDYAQPDSDGEAFIVNGENAVPVALVNRFEMRAIGRRLYAPHTPFCSRKPAAAAKPRGRR